MMEETGTIMSLQEDGSALVLCQRSGACAHCSAATACGGVEDGSSRLVAADNPLAAPVGSRVVIAVSTRTFLRASLLLYIVPLLALVAGALFGQFIGASGKFGLDANRMSAIMGTLGLIAAFVVIRLYSRRQAAQDHRPCIIAVLNKD
jgi:sigma-E factor negative regulatory protein RseC